MLNPIKLITAKRDGKTLSHGELVALVDAYTRGDVPDYQMSAFLMAAFLRGMDETETTALTECMLHSGEVLDLSAIDGAKVDKHSTGGVGDKISIVLAPIVGACGVRVPMISGRGLSHTGGTLDKLESIPGFRTDLSVAELKKQLADLGVVMLGQTLEIAPADRLLYALRDVTATVDFIPFISASIMSKKLAEGLDGLVLDVKTGRGAFMKTEEDARSLAEMLVAIGERFGTPTVAWLTAMDIPLGRAIGNWLEVEESIRCLQGRGEPDIMDLTLQLSGEMICLAGGADSAQEGREQAKEALTSGRAFEKFVQMAEAQGGDASVLRDPRQRRRDAPETRVYAGEYARGFVSDIDALALGTTATAMGVGRIVKEDDVDAEAGILLRKKPGEAISPGAMLASFFTRKRDMVQSCAASIAGAYQFADTPPAPRPILLDRLTRHGWMRGS